VYRQYVPEPCLSSSGFERMVNAFQHPAHRGSQTATRVNTLPTKEGRTSLLRALPPLSQSQTRIAADALQSVELAVARPARDATEVWMAALRQEPPVGLHQCRMLGTTRTCRRVALCLLLLGRTSVSVVVEKARDVVRRIHAREHGSDNENLRATLRTKVHNPDNC
jgi:hypothetical protein